MHAGTRGHVKTVFNDELDHGYDMRYACNGSRMQMICGMWTTLMYAHVHIRTEKLSIENTTVGLAHPHPIMGSMAAHFKITQSHYITRACVSSQRSPQTSSAPTSPLRTGCYKAPPLVWSRRDDGSARVRTDCSLIKYPIYCILLSPLTHEIQNTYYKANI